MVTPVMARNANAQGQIMKKKFMSQSRWDVNDMMTPIFIEEIGRLYIDIWNITANDYVKKSE